MREHERIAVQTDAYGMRLLDFLERRWPEVHRAYFRRLVLAEMVKVNRIIGTPYTVLRRGDVIDITRPEGDVPPRPGPKTEVAPVVRVVESNATICVIDKPAGLDVDQVLQALGDASLADARPVLRVDAEASGLVVLARSAAAARALAVDFAEGRIELAWLALVDGRVDRDTLTLDMALGPDRRHPGRVRVYERDAKRSRPARTEVAAVEVFDRHSLLRVVPRTDRGHQLRVHLAAAHLPVVGDTTYGRGASLMISSFKRKYRPRVGVPERPILERLCLHAHELRYVGEAGERSWSSPLPKEIDAALQRLRRYADR
ncbi:MAG: pseudouridine synthase [Planctomycetota bacterium]